jgi:hypothetical protein
MPRILTLVLCAALALAGAAAFSGGAQVDNSPLLSRLKVGQCVELAKATSGGYQIYVPDDATVDALTRPESKYVLSKILEVGRDFIVVDTGRGLRYTISAHAIHVITESIGAKEAPAENEPKGDAGK